MSFCPPPLVPSVAANILGATLNYNSPLMVDGKHSRHFWTIASSPNKISNPEPWSGFPQKLETLLLGTAKVNMTWEFQGDSFHFPKRQSWCVWSGLGPHHAGREIQPFQSKSLLPLLLLAGGIFMLISFQLPNFASHFPYFSVLLFAPNQEKLTHNEQG